MEKIKKGLSIRLSLFLSVCIAIVIAQFLYMGALFLIDKAMISYMSPKPDTFVYKDGTLVAINYGPIPSAAVEITNPKVYGIMKVLRSVCPVLIYGTCLIISISLFYQYKLKKPLKILNNSIEKIAKQELNFQVPNISDDELGSLCKAFETMRSQLSMTFQTLWKAEENQRSMYRAFAHDLRTPLTVVKGNNEIIELVAAKNDDWIQAVQAVKSSELAIARIEHYADQIKELESIEDLAVSKTAVNLMAFAEMYRQQAEVLAILVNKQVKVECNQDININIDEGMLLRVLDNLLSNALGYAKNCIILRFDVSDGSISVSVSDDGPGFTPEALKQAAEPFYTTNKAGGHMGMGLTVVQKLLHKMQGSLIIKNHHCGGFVKFFLPV